MQKLFNIQKNKSATTAFILVDGLMAGCKSCFFMFMSLFVFLEDTGDYSGMWLPRAFQTDSCLKYPSADFRKNLPAAQC